MKIGIFDSGIGGITLLHEAVQKLPHEKYYFYADVDHVPYGVKTSRQISEYVDEIVRGFIDKQMDAIVIACNTATAVAAEAVRSKYDIPIIGMEPAVKPAVRAATETTGRVLVMATPVTIRENKLRSLLQKVDKEHVVDLLPMPGLVRLAEMEKFEGAEVDAYIDEQLAVLDRALYSEVVLGCTHFNYFKPAIRKAFEEKGLNIELIDGNEGTVRHLAELLGLTMVSEPQDIKNVDISYFESGRPVRDEESLDKYARLHKRLDEINKMAR